MSVINKMLRDLDQRQELPADMAARPANQQLRGTTSLAAPALSGPRWPARRAGPVLVLLVVLAGIGAWWWQKPAAVAAPQAPSLPLGPASDAPSSIPASASAPVLPRTPLPVAATTPPARVAIPPRPAANTGLPATRRADVQPGATAVEPIQLRMTARASSGFKEGAAALVAPAPVATPVGAEAANTTARQVQAGREALAQAQALWSAGSRDAAIELLQQAVAWAERGGNAGAQPLLAATARELGRMQLAEGRAAAALDVLTRLEPSLGREADIWALRGNAAQRLGRHQDSVRAYTAALQIRPGEQRWMLGAAVSLAALGQTQNATEMVDKARALGPVGKEVLAYLRQAGVQVSAP